MGTYSLQAIHEVLATTTFATDGKQYAFLKLDRKAYRELVKALEVFEDPYIELIHDKDELTLIIEQSVWEQELAKRFTALDKVIPISLITCQVTKPTVTGYLLALVSILSPNNIGVFVQGAFTTDHIFVETHQLEKALSLLNQLKA